MSIDKQELRDSAESTIGILENIAGYEPGDIDGDTVELRFEDETGCDTGCDVSLVEQCQNAADVIRALTEALEAAQSRIAELEESHAQVIHSRDHYKRIVDEGLSKLAEARTLTVKLPDPLMPAQHNSGELFMSPDDVEQGGYLNRDDVVRVLRTAGIKLQIEGE